MSITSPAISANTTASPSSALEIASVLVVTQASLSLVAGLSAIPFGIVEPGLRVLSLVTILVAIAMFWMVLPIGAVRGPVAVLVNLVMPAAVLWLLWSRSGRAAFRKAGRSDARGAA